MKIAFLLNDLELSGGVGVVVQHARRLSALPGWDVTLVLVREQDRPNWHGYELEQLHVRSREEVLGEQYDIAIATWWETTFTLFDLQAERYAFFVQSLEDRFYVYDEAERLGAALTLDLPVAFITEARWIADTLRGLRPDASCYLVRNGIDKQTYAPLKHPLSHRDASLRVLVEGSPRAWFKHVHDAIEATSLMQEPRRVTVVTGDREGLGKVEVDDVVGPLDQRAMSSLYRETDVVLKLSSVEGMFGPPLEGFHCAATCVVTPVTGHEEYVEHGWNGLLTDWGDLRGTARTLDLLARNRELLGFLRANALETARAWPSWEQSNQFMAAALLAIRREPAPQPAGASARLVADLRAGLDAYNARLRERGDFERRAMRFERRLARLRASRPARWLARLRRYRVARLLARPLRPFTRRLRRVLS